MTCDVSSSFCNISANEFPERRYLQRNIVAQVAAASEYHSQAWKKLGLELLENDPYAYQDLDIISQNYKHVDTCCEKMFSLWLQKQEDATWTQLIDALKALNLNKIASNIRKCLQPSHAEWQSTATVMPMQNQQTDQGTGGM